MDVLRPCVVQVSGGEPLMRPDLVDIVRAIKDRNGLPYTILVSNWSLMTEERYLELRAAGINQFSVSLDFPDQRHDDFRRPPGFVQPSGRPSFRAFRLSATTTSSEHLHHERERRRDKPGR
jgi:MoaA/NifB/PqqE/SkfB family radical SAM enzyme